jgi:hypothetical protein
MVPGARPAALAAPVPLGRRGHALPARPSANPASMPPLRTPARV